MKTLFVDMDGVLCDFDKSYRELLNTTPSEVRQGSTEQYETNWQKCLKAKMFAELDYHAGAEELIEFCNSLQSITVAILTSTRNFESYNTVRAQKEQWLKKHKIDWPFIAVPGWRFKAGFATADSFLIDDTKNVVKSFVNAGGHAVLHTDAIISKSVVEKWLAPAQVRF